MFPFGTPPCSAREVQLSRTSATATPRNSVRPFHGRNSAATPWPLSLRLGPPGYPRSLKIGNFSENFSHLRYPQFVKIWDSRTFSYHLARKLKIHKNLKVVKFESPTNFRQNESVEKTPRKENSYLLVLQKNYSKILEKDALDPVAADSASDPCTSFLQRSCC